MTQAIQSQPVGNLSLLGIKSLGVNASKYPDTLTPTLDQLAQYLAGRGITTFQGQTAGAVAVGSFSSIPIPQGEAWFVWGVSAVLFVTNVGQPIDVSLLFLPTNASFAFPLPLTYPAPAGTASAVVNQRIDFGGLMPQPFIARPGAQFQTVMNRAMAAGTATIETRVLATVLEV